MSLILTCPYRELQGAQPVCQIVAEFMGRPLAECHVNDSACVHCLNGQVAPQTPNAVVASMAIGVAARTQDQAFLKRTVDRFRDFLNKPPAPITACVLRGPAVRSVPCKPCQADSPVAVMMPVFRCPRHDECTLHNTGTFPRIQACATCAERLEEYVQIDVRQAPPAVLAAIPQRGRSRP